MPGELEVVVRAGHPDFLDLPVVGAARGVAVRPDRPHGRGRLAPRRRASSPTTTASTPSRRPTRASAEREYRMLLGPAGGEPAGRRAGRRRAVAGRGGLGTGRPARRSSPATSTTRCPTTTCSPAAGGPGLLDRLLDGGAVLMARLHLEGFYWGDFSLSNALFRRDAGAFVVYLVDAETAEQRPSSRDGLRANDVERGGREHRGRPGRPPGGGPDRGGPRPVRASPRASATATAPSGSS